MHERHRRWMRYCGGPARALALCAIVLGTACSSADPASVEPDVGESASAVRHFNGQEIFRYHTYGDERLWTDKLHLNEVIQQSVDPMTALAVGLKVDTDALPPGLLASADLNDPATTLTLIDLNAVLGLQGKVDED